MPVLRPRLEALHMPFVGPTNLDDAASLLPSAKSFAGGDPYLRPTPIIDWDHPDVLARARGFGDGDSREVARRCFEWVRDAIRHSGDHQLDTPTCTASETLAAGAGLCYAKSHLLAALLRANSIRAGLCYQRLSQDGDGAPFCLHGLVAVMLPGIGWYRIDPRGNRPDIDAQFAPPIEQLAFPIMHNGEADLPEIWADPLPIVTDALQTARSLHELLGRLPDVPTLTEGRPS
jgi:transglutaminase-like putative cysteine protease